MSGVLHHAVCQGCGLLCDDIEVRTDGAAIVSAERACDLGRRWVQEQAAVAVSDADAVRQAAELLTASRFPMLLGIERLPTEAQRILVRIAESLGGVIAGDSIPALIARQEVGEVTATLGEIKARADLVVFWFADPAATHPRFAERFLGEGRFLPNGRKDRTIIVVGGPANATIGMADEFIELSANAEFDALTELRMEVGVPPSGGLLNRLKPGLQRGPIRRLAERMKAAKYGAVVFDSAANDGSVSRRETLFRLTRDLNMHTAFVAVPLGKGGNAKGAEAVLQWTTGFPGNVAFMGGNPNYNGNEFSAESLLPRGRVDAAIVFGDWNDRSLSPTARNRLAAIPTARLSFGGALRNAGTVFRMDGVPLFAERWIDEQNANAEGVLQSLLDEVERRKG